MSLMKASWNEVTATAALRISAPFSRCCGRAAASPRALIVAEPAASADPPLFASLSMLPRRPGTVALLPPCFIAGRAYLLAAPGALPMAGCDDDYWELRPARYS